ncbi:methyltransferase family protein [Clostridium manihotivorum]|uniref:Isoprenylcysteine carboxylmethyltransferase family protein n=1 Tax=Clostridium manihotivorum TaxID=2320868 RepID=A0A410DPW1_9CLOT|nr:isoprenylcysteine carboxylmethyltransferase family protein [Clostridium manihotivorum]QAA31070.1 hypothetical protein C1I91_04990 [Clostridium manihotivorum]
MYLFGHSYFETTTMCYVFQIIFTLFLASEILFFLFTSYESLKNSGKKKSSDKGSFFLITLGITSIVFINMFCRKNLFLILASSFFWLGTLFTIAGILLRAYSIWTLRKFFTFNVQVNSNQKIVQTGPYKLIRHPAYSGSILTLIGISFCFRSFIGILISLIIVSLIYGYRISIEENALIESFKTSYIEYIKNTKKIVPFIW